MVQYLNLLQEIKDKGTWKFPARENMPRTLSLFGAQYRCNLQDGFPLLTTKEIRFKNIVTELLWFLRGDTNIKYLVDNGCNIWNEDAYNYYLKLCKQNIVNPMPFDDFMVIIKNNSKIESIDLKSKGIGYFYGDCGWQYGRLWRNLEVEKYTDFDGIIYTKHIDQISELIEGLKKSPESRRHILTALNPAHYNDLALFPCHVLAQFNCRPLSKQEKYCYDTKTGKIDLSIIEKLNVNEKEIDNVLLRHKKYFGDIIPKYYLDCHLYQRSCDVFLGVPYNTASYALLTHILSEICGMIPGDLVHTFGDVHIYENHIDQVNEQLKRIPSELPKLNILTNLNYGFNEYGLDGMLNSLNFSSFTLSGYNPQPPIKAKLSTGLK